MLSQIMTKISGGVTFLGGVLIVFGLVNLGMTIKDGIRRFSNMSRNAMSACIRTTSCKPTIRGDSRNAMQRPRMRQGI